MPNDPEFKEKHFRAATIHIGKPELVVSNPEEPNVVTPLCVCRVVTENGQIWQCVALQFQAHKELVAQLWDVKPSHFTRFQ